MQSLKGLKLPEGISLKSLGDPRRSLVDGAQGLLGAAHEAADAAAQGAAVGAAIFGVDERLGDLTGACGIRGKSIETGDGKARTGLLKSFGAKVVIDDDHATLVLLFPKQPGHVPGSDVPLLTRRTEPQSSESDSDGSSSDDNHEGAPLAAACGLGRGGQAEMVDEPSVRAKEIFVQEDEEDLEMLFGTKRMTKYRFFLLVREKVEDVFKHLQLRTEVFTSVDDDEVFMKVTAEPQGKVIKRLAGLYMYKLPFKRETYDLMDDKHPGPPLDDNGDEVLSHFEYAGAWRSKLQEFRDVDVIRLLTSHIRNYIDLTKLEEHGAKWFPAANYDKVKELDFNWARFSKFMTIPTIQNIDMVRDYFGEEIAFFFNFFASYIKHLTFLAALACVEVPLEWDWVGISYQNQNVVKLCFGICLVIWATTFQLSFEHQVDRSKQRWGMNEFESKQRVVLSEYVEAKDGTWQLRLAIAAGKAAMVAYIFLFCVCWSTVQTNVPRAWRTTASTVTTFLFSWLWGSKIAAPLVSCQNHRTQARKNNALVQTLAYVKLGVFLAPFIKLAFLHDLFEAKCYTDPAVAFGQTFNITESLNPLPPLGYVVPDHARPLPVGIQEGIGWFGEYTFDVGADTSPKVNAFLADHLWLINTFLPGLKVKPTDTVCVWGCVPSKCDVDADGVGAYCLTECYTSLQEQLRQVFVTHVICTLVFLCIPLILTNRTVKAEVAKVKAMGGGAQYSFLQYQAKCEKYEYYGWGGSYVEDFMEVVLGFALLACFGIICPFLAIAGLFGQLMEYRLLAYRMTHVTRRPYPEGSEGIGTWHTVLEVVLVLAALINAGLAAFRMRTSFRRWPMEEKTIFFFAFGYCLLGLRLGLRVLYPHTPGDVTRINDYQADFLKTITSELEKDRDTVPMSPSSPARARRASAATGPASSVRDISFKG